MPSISVPTAVIGAGVLGAGASIISSNNAASAQTSAANQANNTQLGMYNTTRADLSPYNVAGQGATNALTDLSGTGSGGNPLSSYFGPVSMTESQLEQTPGYQFNLTQGLKATQNSAAARGLGASGAALKGAASYATGLADSTYQNQFNNAVTNQTNVYNRLMGVSNQGENAAAQTGALGTQAATNIGANTVGAGNALAASALNQGQAVGNAANSAGNLYLLNALSKSSGGTGIFGS